MTPSTHGPRRSSPAPAVPPPLVAPPSPGRAAASHVELDFRREPGRHPVEASRPLASRLARVFMGIGLLLVVSQIVQVTALGWFLPSLAFLGGFGAVMGAVMSLAPGRTPSSASRPNTDDLEEIAAGLDRTGRAIWVVGLVLAGVAGWLFVLLLDWVAYP